MKTEHNIRDTNVNLPNFLIIGATKAGSSSLAAQLKQHPEIFISEIKEPHFFNREWDRGISWYSKLFEGSMQYAAVGEASVSYTLYPNCQNVPLRIRETLGSKVKLIYILRHPVDRLISHYKHSIIISTMPKDIGLRDALKRNSNYRYGSNYYTQLQEFLKYFKPNQIKILIFEDYISNPIKTHKEIFQFLGVNSDYVVPDLKPVNVSSEKVRLPPWLTNMIRNGDPQLMTKIRVAAGKLLGIKPLLKKLLGSKPAFNDIDTELYNELYAEFTCEIQQLSEFTGIQLGDIWQKRN